MNDGLQLSGLTVAAGGRIVLADLDLTVAPGHAVRIVGPPASGKSSVLAVLAGEQRPRAGRVILDGQPVHSPSVRLHLGYAPQQSRILDTLTALENVALPLLAERINAADAWRQAGDALDALGLENITWHNLAEQLSGGQRQRVALARVTVNRPSFLVLDDPTSELDAETAVRVRESVAGLMAAGTTVALATTDPGLADLADGEIVLSGR